MTDLTVLHLSDLHFCPSKLKDINIVKEALFKDLEYLKGEGLQPDIGVFSGDLIDKGDFGYSEQRNDYDSVRSEFIDPLLALLDLDTDRFFICAGNHDVQRNKVKRFLEVGVKQELVNKQAVNSLIDDFESNRDVFARMTNFERFKESINGKFARTSNELFSTYILDKADKRIGIACINSAWRAYGGKGDDGRERDYGELLIGERTIDKCVDDLKECDLRIGVVHHPFEYLQPFERTDLKWLIFRTFNFWLMGHTHVPEFASVQTFNNDRTAVITGGTLYRSRDYYNGYSLIRYSLTECSGKVYLREYADRGRRFIPALAYAKDQGIVSFTLSKDSVVPLSGNYSLIVRMRDNVVNQVNKLLLPAIVEQSIAPKELKEIFVEPPLAIESEYKSMSLETRRRKDETTRTLDEILESSKNILFIGKKESGKTTLLNYIRTVYLEPDTFETAKIPLLINYKNLPKGKDRIKKAVSKYMYDLQVSFDLEGNLRQGNCLLLVDDLDLGDKKALASLVQFTKDYPRSRYMFAIDEDIFADMEFDKSLDLGVDYDRIYIHSFGRKQIRGLASKWFYESPIDIDTGELSDTILSHLLQTGIPCTPLTISLMLLIIEQQPDYIPINKASLLENLIEILLEKMYPLDGLEGIDYRNKEDFLSHIAHYMVREKKYRLDVNELERETRDYFESRGLPIPGEIQSFINYFIRRGILASDSGWIYFRFKCFCEFFIAKCMIENKDFYEEILAEDSYLAFANEIDYMTGLERKNKDLLALLNERTQESVEDFLDHVGLKIELEYFDDIALDKGALDSLSEKDRETVVERLRESIVREEVKDEYSDTIYRLSRGEDQEITKDTYTYEDYWTLLMANLALFARVIKNCELIDDKEFKKENVNVCMQSFLKLLYVAILRSEKFVEELDYEEVLEQLSSLEIESVFEFDKLVKEPERLRESLRYFFKTFLFFFIQIVTYGLLGTPKLKIIQNFTN